MPKEVVVLELCDECFAHDVRRDADATLTIGVNGEWRTLLVCEEHEAEVQHVVDIVTLYGTTAEAPAKAKRQRQPGVGRPVIYDGEMDCPIPGCTSHHPTRKAWRQHVKQKHKMNLAQMRERFPEVAA